MANSGGIVSNIFRFFTRVAKSSEKKGNKTKTRNKTGTVQKTRKTSAEFPHFLRGKHVLISELINARGTITSGKSAVYMSRSDNDMYVFLKIF